MGRACLFGHGIPVFSERSFIQPCMRVPLTAGPGGALVVVFLLFLFVGIGLSQLAAAVDRVGGGGGRDDGPSGGPEIMEVQSGTGEAKSRAPRVKILPPSSAQRPAEAAPLSEPWERFCEQIEGLVRVELAAEKWCAARGVLPKTLEELVQAGGYFNEIPEDVYADGRPLSYRVAGAKRFGIIYSYGPDGDDDGGVSIPVYRLDASGPPPDGDIVVFVLLSHVLRERNPLLKKFDASFEDQSLLDALLYMKEQDGRDNAMIYYVEAEKLQPELSELPDGDYEYGVVQHVLEKGWDEGLTELRDYLAKWQPMFGRIRQGTRVGYARNIGVTLATPNYTAASYGGKMLCVEGRYFESQGRYADALDNYLTALTMGRDYGSPGGEQIHALMSIAIQELTLESIYRLVTTDHLDGPSLDRLACGLRDVEKTQVPVVDMFRNDGARSALAYERYRQDPEFLERLCKEAPEGWKELIEDVLRHCDFRADRKRIWDFLETSAEIPYWELDTEARQRERQALLEGPCPLAEAVIANYEEVNMRYRVMMAKLLLTRIATALAAYKLDHQTFPEHLSGLVPDYLESVPIDPFGGKEFSGLYSVGPDREDDGGKVQYDATNGTMSRGDVYLR